MPDIPVNDRVVVPEAAVETKAVRASGPGGQNVNKVSSKIQMRVDLTRVLGLAEGDLGRLRTFLQSRLDADGRLFVSSQETRDQGRNRDDCASKVAELIRAGLVRPKFRRRTRPTHASKLRRVESKRRRADQIQQRRVDD